MTMQDDETGDLGDLAPVTPQKVAAFLRNLDDDPPEPEQDAAKETDVLARIKIMLARQADLGRQLTLIVKDGFEVVQAHEEQIEKMRTLAQIQTNMLAEIVDRLVALEKKVK
jgi:hypothetical protein